MPDEGYTLDERSVRRTAAAVADAEAARRRGGVDLGPTPARRPPRDDAIWAKLTDVSKDANGRWSYGWYEVYLSAAGYGQWAAVPNGASYSRFGKALNGADDEQGAADAHRVAARIVVRLRWVPSDEAGGGQYWFTASTGSALPPGLGQFKVLQLNADNVPIWDWVRAHDGTPGAGATGPAASPEAV